jgi:uncharacterized OB-fold protein
MDFLEDLFDLGGRRRHGQGGYGHDDHQHGHDDRNYRSENPEDGHRYREPQDIAVIPCGKCGSKRAPGFKFCPECGTPAATSRKCESCGIDVLPQAKFCPSCGTKVPA